MARAFLHPERRTLHGREVDAHNVVCEETHVLDGGEVFFVDPIVGDRSLYVGGYVLWPKESTSVAVKPSEAALDDTKERTSDEVSVKSQDEGVPTTPTVNPSEAALDDTKEMSSDEASVKSHEEGVPTTPTVNPSEAALDDTEEMSSNEVYVKSQDEGVPTTPAVNPSEAALDDTNKL